MIARMKSQARVRTDDSGWTRVKRCLTEPAPVPTAARRQAVPFEQNPEIREVHSVRARGGKISIASKPSSLALRQEAGEVVPEHEGTRPEPRGLD